MRPIDLKSLHKLASPFGRRRHPCDSGAPSKLPRDVLMHLMKASSWRAHPEPFAKGKRGGQRRAERRFMRTRKCGFGCS